MALCIIATGGSFGKEYNQLTGELFFRDTHLPEMLRLGVVSSQMVIGTLDIINSLHWMITTATCLQHGV